MACKHVTSDLQPPRPSQSVYRDDCTQCFDSAVSHRRLFLQLPTN